MILESVNSLPEAFAVPESEEYKFSMDEGAFDHFYRSTSRPLWAYVYRTCGNATLADDILQETYCRFLKASPDLADFRQLRSYLYRIATNLVSDHWRRNKRETSLEDRCPPVSPDCPSDESLNLKTDFQRCLRLLSHKERSLLWLAYVEGAAHREIGEILGLKEKSVKVLLFRARKKMATILEKRSLP